VKKTSIIFLDLLILMMLSFPQEMKTIKEEISVDWWVIPFFAVDNSGSSVLNLKKEDIELYIGKHKIKDFSISKKGFYTTSETDKDKISGDQKNYIFLVFDATLSNRKTVKNALNIAEKIVKSSGLNNYFVLMSIEPYKGLIYHSGPTNNKNEILGFLKQRIKSKYQKVLSDMRAKLESRLSGRANVFSDESRGNIRSAENQSINKSGLSRLLIQQIKAIYNDLQESVYLKSLITLGYGLRTLEENKFVYFFSSGIRNRKFTGTDNRNHFKNLCKSVTHLINQNGAVLFNVNPSGIGENVIFSAGDISLRHLAKLSGGEYLDGKIKEISNRIENINQSYYEINFPDSNEFKGDIYKISIIPRKEGIKIYSLRIVSRGKSYNRMDKLEKEILVLSIIENGYLAKAKVKLIKPEIIKYSIQKGKINYSIKLPENMIEKELDIYDIFLNEKMNDTIIKKNVRIIKNREITILRKVKKDYKYNCVIIHGESNIAFYIHSSLIK